MTDKKLFLEYPAKRIKPIDGLAVTARVWEEAHDFHRHRLRLHTKLLHGAGIVGGLQVIASDPPDTSLYITPGMAVDPQGEIIVVTEPVAFDLGPARDYLYLVLTYGESHPIQDDPIGPAYVSSEFSVEVSSQSTGLTGVVLARLRRERGAAVTDAKNPELPGVNEIDLRFRSVLAPLFSGSTPPASMAVFYPAGQAGFKEAHGAVWLAKALHNTGKQLCIDDSVPLNADLARYDLLYMVASGGFQLSREQMTHLYSFIGSGGTVFMDCCMKDSQLGAAAAASFMDLAGSFGTELQEVQPGHPLLSKPHLFGRPPSGYEDSPDSHLLVGNGIIVSNQDYGCVWQGERRERPAWREEIRTAVEWGENILTYAVERKQEAANK